MMIVGRGSPIPNNVYDYSFADLNNLYRKTIDPEMGELVESFKDRQIVSKKAEKLSVNNIT